MTASGSNANYRAPAENGQVLCVPSWEAMPKVVEAARRPLLGDSSGLFDRSWNELAQSARQSLLSAAWEYSSSYCNISHPRFTEQPLIITGHQPELFHPGVWLKNFFAGRLAKEIGGIAVNLIIDNDLCRNPSIRVPIGSVTNPQVVSIAFDQVGLEVPFEERLIADWSLWKSFGSRVAKVLEPLVPHPLVGEFWSDAILEESGRVGLGSRLSQARHKIEQSWGNQTLEVPESYVCRTAEFRWFALDVLVRAEEFRAAYNQSLADYRTAHKLRNQAQPLPDLEAEEGWIETPFWIWSCTDPRRRGLFVRVDSQCVQVTDRHAFHDSLPLQREGKPDLALEKIGDWEFQGIKLRTRALTTTLFARLFLADLFIHGIGGAKYDQVTNALCRRFYGRELPEFAVVSGTLHLPLAVPNRQGEIPTLQRELRELAYHPERFIEQAFGGGGEPQRTKELVANKLHWVHLAKTAENAAQRHRQIVASNRELQGLLSAKREHLQQQLADSLRQETTLKILRSREYAYCLFPSESLRSFLS